MEKLKRTKMKAGAFAVAMLFLAMTAATTITSAFIVPVVQHAEQAIAITPDPQESQETQSEQIDVSCLWLGTEYNESADFTLPPGVSCKPVVQTVRRPFVYFYQGNFVAGTFDAGFNFWLVKLCNGQQHSFEFNGEIKTNYEEGGAWSIESLNIPPITWNSNCGIWIDLIHVHREYWYNEKHLDGTGTRDIGPPIPVHKTYYGLLAFLPEDFNPYPGA
jgi:hypothetical protein